MANKVNENPIETFEQAVRDLELQEAAAKNEIREAEQQLSRARIIAERIAMLRQGTESILQRLLEEPTFKVRSLPKGEEDGWKQRNPGWYGAGLHSRAREIIVHYGNNPMDLNTIYEILLDQPMMQGLHKDSLRNALDANCKSKTPQLVKVSPEGTHPIYGVYGVHTKPKGVRRVQRLPEGGR